MFLKISLVFVFSYFCVSFAHCWDLAVTSGHEIHLLSATNSDGNYNSSNAIIDDKTEHIISMHDDSLVLSTITYDPIDHRLFILANQSLIQIVYLNQNNSHNNNNTVIDLNLNTTSTIEIIQYEPFTNSLYWIENKQRIMRMIVNTQQIQQILQFNHSQHELTSLALHSCRGYIFWTNSHIVSPTIERATLSGTNVETIVHENMYYPTTITVDQEYNRIYWVDDSDGDKYQIESADLNGHNRQLLLQGRFQHPHGIVLNQRQIFWIDFNEIWSMDKHDDVTHLLYEYHLPKMASLSSTFVPQEQCELSTTTTTTTTRMIPLILPSPSPTTTTATSTTTTINNNTTTTTINCLNNGEMYKNADGKLICKCRPSYVGAQCEIPACHNFCIFGECSTTTLNEMDVPVCECHAGYTGLRCEINKCHQYCLNDGHCTVDNDDTNDNVHCTCLDGFSGDRCQYRNNHTNELCDIICGQHDLYQILKSQHDTTLCKCLVYDVNIPAAASSNLQEAEEILSSSERRDTAAAAVADQIESDSMMTSYNGILTKLQDPFVIVLIVLVIVLIPINMALTTAVCWLRKRPRIKRRIIVNKNVTPLTCRPLPQPDQCEITIENCCNMNICETPCFEPPQLRTSKSTKTEEKKTLLTNMENGDDFY